MNQGFYSSVREKMFFLASNGWASLKEDRFSTTIGILILGSLFSIALDVQGMNLAWENLLNSNIVRQLIVSAVFRLPYWCIFSLAISLWAKSVILKQNSVSDWIAAFALTFLLIVVAGIVDGLLISMRVSLFGW